MTDFRRISRLEARIGRFFTSDIWKLDEHGQVLSSDPSELELARFVDPNQNQSLSISDKPENLSGAPKLLPWWLVVVGIGSIFALAIWAPPEPGIEPSPLAVRLIGCSVLSVIGLMLIYMLNAIQKVKGVYFVYDKLDRTLELPRYKLILAPDQIHSFVMFQAPISSGGKRWELSVLARIDRGGLARYSLGIDFSSKIMNKLCVMLAESMNVPLTALKLNRKKLKAMGLKWKDVWNHQNRNVKS